jgi:hypothetical protein
MATSHDPQVFHELLRLFREGYAKFGTAPFDVVGLTLRERDSLPDDKRKCLLEYLGYVSWFMDAAQYVEERGFVV